MFRKSFPARISGVLVILAVLLASCLPAARIGGIVQGVIYGDMNGSGGIDPGEGPLDGAEVTLADCGSTQTQVTGADGTFNFTGLPEGTCHIAVSKGGWIFSGSYPALAYPVPVASNPDLPTGLSLFMAPLTDSIPAATPTPVPLLPSATATATATATTAATATSSVPMVTPINQDVNCRYGPSMDYSSVGALLVGVSVRIRGTNSSHTWWQIESPQDPGTYCWVSGAVTQTSGDLSGLPVIPNPLGLVVDVAVEAMSNIAGFCGMPNAFSPRGTISTNGPATVVFHWEIWRDGSLFHSTANETIVFTKAASKTIDPGADKGDCGNYTVKLIVTSPNSLSAQQTFKIYSP
ncbi:MAG: hypothetical protein FD146_622 [Anaerolineaceae bacterium]|nr:MAG: hypothetical protein FD146_622 [Anaerolineaceae bacterium]